MRRLYVFDMDGTLLPNTTACLEIAKATNSLSELHRLEEEWRVGVIDTKQFADSLHGMWGGLKPPTIRSVFAACPKLRNIKPVVEDIRNRSDLSCLITMSPHY